jgi:putative pyruvate formate lyase activating enzyme
MPDFKFWHLDSGKAFCRVPDYHLQAAAAIREMHHQVGDLKISEEGVAERGLLVRHLVMPGRASESEEIMKFLAALSTDTYVNIMDQYRPCGMAMKDPNIGRRTYRSEWTAVCRQALDAGLHRLDKE